MRRSETEQGAPRYAMRTGERRHSHLLQPGCAPTPRTSGRALRQKETSTAPHAESGRARRQRDTSTVPPRREWMNATTARDFNRALRREWTSATTARNFNRAPRREWTSATTERYFNRAPTPRVDDERDDSERLQPRPQRHKCKSATTVTETAT